MNRLGLIARACGYGALKAICECLEQVGRAMENNNER